MSNDTYYLKHSKTKKDYSSKKKDELNRNKNIRR